MESLQAQLNDLQEQLDRLRSSTTIPYEIEQSFRTRFNLDTLAELRSSAKEGSTEAQAVNESGSGSYSVAKVPDGFREFIVGGTVFYIPYYL